MSTNRQEIAWLLISGMKKTAKRNSTRNALSACWTLLCFVILAAVQGFANPVPVLAQERGFVSNSRLILGTESSLSASVRAGDLDGDGQIDLVVANGRHWAQQNFLFFNQGSSRFNLIRRLGEDLATTYATELADLDADGDLDIVVGNDTAPNLVLLNDGNGRFQRHVEFGVVSSLRSLTLADIDQDGDVDILATCRGKQNYFCLNDGKATFGAGVSFGNPDDSTIAVAVADLNKDGHPDLVLANRDRQQNYVLFNSGKTEFANRVPFGTGADETRAVAVGDLNEDGNLDIVAANIGQPNAVYLGDGTGQFGEALNFGRADGNSYALGIADMNGDKKLDLIIGNAGQQNSVFFNLGSGTKFQQVNFGGQSNATYGLTVGDFNADGYRDIAVANSNEKNFVFLNRPATGNRK